MPPSLRDRLPWEYKIAEIRSAAHEDETGMIASGMTLTDQYVTFTYARSCHIKGIACAYELSHIGCIQAQFIAIASRWLSRYRTEAEMSTEWACRAKARDAIREYTCYFSDRLAYTARAPLLLKTGLTIFTDSKASSAMLLALSSEENRLASPDPGNLIDRVGIISVTEAASHSEPLRCHWR